MFFWELWPFSLFWELFTKSDKFRGPNSYHFSEIAQFGGCCRAWTKSLGKAILIIPEFAGLAKFWMQSNKGWSLKIDGASYAAIDSSREETSRGSWGCYTSSEISGSNDRILVSFTGAKRSLSGGPNPGLVSQVELSSALRFILYSVKLTSSDYWLIPQYSISL